MSNYTEHYYTSNNYSNYLERYGRYEKLTLEIVDLLNKLNLISKNSTILDFGCAVGFLLESLNKIGYSNCFGVEISDWARNECLKKNLSVFKETPIKKFDLLFVLDVLEHLTDSDIISNINKIKPKIIVLRIPVSEKEGENYYLDISRKDPTHINCKTKNQWKNLLKNLGFDVFLHLNLNTIYDSTGVLSLICLRKEFN